MNNYFQFAAKIMAVVDSVNRSNPLHVMVVTTSLEVKHYKVVPSKFTYDKDGIHLNVVIGNESITLNYDEFIKVGNVYIGIFKDEENAKEAFNKLVDEITSTNVFIIPKYFSHD